MSRIVDDDGRGVFQDATGQVGWSDEAGDVLMPVAEFGGATLGTKGFGEAVIDVFNPTAGSLATAELDLTTAPTGAESPPLLTSATFTLSYA
jgi:hypothetical protein